MAKDVAVEAGFDRLTVNTALVPSVTVDIVDGAVADVGDGRGAVVVGDVAGAGDAADGEGEGLSRFADRIVDGGHGDGEAGDAGRDDDIAAGQGHAVAENQGIRIVVGQHGGAVGQGQGEGRGGG